MRQVDYRRMPLMTSKHKVRKVIYYGISRLLVALGLVTITVYLGRAIDSRSMLPIQVEHRVRLAGEFRADQEAITDWNGYLEREKRIAVETDNAIGPRTADRDNFDRHGVGSLSNPNEHAVNWNRSFVFQAAKNKGSAVLLHGLSDSPYSVRATAEQMHGRGISTYAPRMPGHGFAVGDLRHARWEDWMAAVRIAMRAADAERQAGQPLFLAGYSNGGLLAIRYALDCASRIDMPCPDGILLLSPAIDVTAFARLARWHRAISWTSYFEQFQWDTIMPEVDPYKFTSFPKNPGREIFAATRAIDKDLASATLELPPLLAFQSVVDDTVNTEAVINLFRRLSSNDSELILYDVNRSDQATSLMIHPPEDILTAIQSDLPLPFSITVVTNRDADSRDVQAVRYDSQAQTPVRRDLDLIWPSTVFSLSHIAVPFRPDDPIYGAASAANPLSLGSITPRGERKVLSLTPNYFARLRHNPFYAYQQDRIDRWLDRWLEAADAAESR